MTLGIDAANIRGGGGVTHLVETLRAARPFEHGFSKVIVWGGCETLRRIDNSPWLEKSHHPVLDRPLVYRTFFQRFQLSRLARDAGCDVLLVPGGSFVGSFRPLVAMSQNLLPFEATERKRFGKSVMAAKLLALRVAQGRTFKRAEGVIFLSRYARDVVVRAIRKTAARTTIIPHGIDRRFSAPPRGQLPIESYSVERPFQILYVSTVDMYKHQWNVVEAVAQLRKAGWPVTLELLGGAYPPALELLRKAMERADPRGEFVRYDEPIAHNQIHERYASADLCIFASSCENLPNILLEAMASGLPIASSDRGPMPEVLGDAGVYFDPLDCADIAQALRRLIEFPEPRARVAHAASERAKEFTWERCASDTFGFLGAIAGEGRRLDYLRHER